MHFSSATEAFLEAASLAEDGFFEAATAAPAAPAAPAAASGLEAVFVCILHYYFLFFFFNKSILVSCLATVQQTRNRMFRK
jgi:hypothetical protein